MLMAVICVSGAPSDYGNEENIVYDPYYNNSYHIVSIINDKTVYAMEPNFWNVNSSVGIVNMSYDYNSNTLNVYANVSNITIRNIYSCVDGYSEILYGRSPWGNYTINKENGTKFPIYVKNLSNQYSNIYIDVNYSINNYSNGLPMDFSFDFWITKYEDETIITLDDVELMIWLYSDNDLTPAGDYIGDITIPIYINGTLVNNTWKIMYQKPQFRWAYISYVSNISLKKNEVKIDIIPFINKTLQIVINDSDGRVNDSNLYLQGCELGFEFGKTYVLNNTYITTNNATFNWSIYNFEVNAIPLKPDLITDIQAPNQMMVNQTYIINISIKNLGGAISNTSLCILGQLNENITINETKYFNLSKNESSIVAINYTPKENGTLYIVAEADPENIIMESNETNNNKTILINISGLSKLNETNNNKTIPVSITSSSSSPSSSPTYYSGSSFYYYTTTTTTESYPGVAKDIESEKIKEIVHKSKLIVGSEVDEDLSAKHLKNTVELINQSLEINEGCILVGGPVANPLVKKYAWTFKVKITNDYPGANKGVIQKQLINGYTVILLAGSDRWGTKAAVEYFKTLDDIPPESIFVEWMDGRVVKIEKP